jgi:hypothetical protein
MVVFRRILQEFIRDMVQEGVVRLHHLSTDEQIIDIFNKPLSRKSLARMQIFPWGSINDCNIMSIFQDRSDRLDHV